MCTCATKSPEDMKKRALLRLFLFDLERERERVCSIVITAGDSDDLKDMLTNGVLDY